RLEVAKDDAVQVRRLDRAADLVEQAHDPREREAALLAHEVAERPAREKFLDDEHGAFARDAEVVDLHDVRVADPRGDLRLARERLDGRGVLQEGGREDANRDAVAERDAARAVDRPRGDLGDLRLDLVLVVDDEGRRAGAFGRTRGGDLARVVDRVRYRLD